MRLQQLELLLDRAAERGAIDPEKAARAKHDLNLAARESDDPMPDGWPPQLVAAGAGPKEMARRGRAYLERRYAEQAARGQRRLLAERLVAGLAAPDGPGGTVVPSGADAATVAAPGAAGGHPGDRPPGGA